MPTLYKRGKKPRWKGVVTVNKVRKEKVFEDATKKTKRKAIQWEIEMRIQLQKEQEQMLTPTACCPDILKLSTDYLGDVKARCVEKTYKEKKSVLKDFITQFGDSTPADDITVQDARLHLTDILQERTPNVANKHRKNLAALYNWASQFVTGFPEMVNPFEKVPKFPEEQTDRYVPPVEDFYKVLSIAEGQDRVILLAFFMTGARRNELWNLTWDDVDFETQQVRLWTRKRNGGGKEFDKIPMVQDLTEALKDWKEQQAFKFDNVFTNTCSQSVGYMEPYKNRIRFMHRICEKAGVKFFGYHAMRHLAATHLYKNGHPQSLIQKILRHKNPNTTARYIKSMGVEEAREAMENTLTVPKV